ncbi:MAG: ATP-grasp domain-containing protein [Clostridiaceae bacterium]
MKILLTAIGKRVQLIKHLKKSCTIIGVDAGELAPAIDFVDDFYKISKYSEKGYIEELLNICREEKIDFLIPLYEREFPLLCHHRKDFLHLGTTLLLSDKEIIDICNDKWKSYKFFEDNNIDTPKTYDKNSIKEILRDNSKLKELKFPLIIKPIYGMGSAGVFKAYDKSQLEFFMDYVKEPIIQEFIEGTEYTMDILSDLLGNVISIVPRERIEVRSGEVSKTRTIKDISIISATLDLCNKLRQIRGTSKVSENYPLTIMGPLTIQCIVNKNKEIKFIEINPRFGGGVPLSFHAGVDYGDYFVKMKKGELITPIIGEFEELTMLRYDEAIFK